MGVFFIDTQTRPSGRLRTQRTGLCPPFAVTAGIAVILTAGLQLESRAFNRFSQVRFIFSV